jgi:hypothetical protein
VFKEDFVDLSFQVVNLIIEGLESLAVILLFGLWDSFAFFFSLSEPASEGHDEFSEGMFGFDRVFEGPD